MKRCLEKDRRARVGDISVALFLLEERIALTPSTGADAATAERNVAAAVSNVRRELTRVTRRWQLSTALLAILAGGATWALWRQPADASKPLVRLDVDLGDEVSLSGNQGREVVISPDGSRIVYVSNDRLHTRTLDGAESVELKGTEGGFAPFFSPDGRAVGFFAARQLKTFTFDGGLIATISASGALPRSATWGDDGTIVADLNIDGRLWTVPVSGGEPLALTESNGGTESHRFPLVLPGSTAALFTAAIATGASELRVVSIRDRRVRTLRTGSSPRFIPTSPSDGFLIFFEGATLYASRFRLDTLELVGAAVPMLDQIAPGPSGIAQFDLSQTGRVVFQSGMQNTRNVVIQWLTPAGLAPLLNRPGAYSRVAVSPAGDRIAFRSQGRQDPRRTCGCTS